VTREERRKEGRQEERWMGYLIMKDMLSKRERGLFEEEEKASPFIGKRKQPKLSCFGQRKSRFQRALLHSENDRVYSKNL
jgi:hypothetical protein